VGLLQRVFDEEGFPTISITTVKEITLAVKPSCACYVEHPFGFTLGELGDKQRQKAILKRVLKEATGHYDPGTIIDLPYKWIKDDLRDRQLRKEAH
jgi:hypothetical protein